MSTETTLAVDTAANILRQLDKLEPAFARHGEKLERIDARLEKALDTLTATLTRLEVGLGSTETRITDLKDKIPSIRQILGVVFAANAGILALAAGWNHHLK
jgi:hypothetical protein